MSDEKPNMESWSVAERFICQRMDRIEGKLDDTSEKVFEIHGDVSGLKVRASVFGVIGGAIIALIAKLGGHS